MKVNSTTSTATQRSPVTSEAMAPKPASPAWVPSIFAKNNSAPTSSVQQVAYCCCYAAAAALLGSTCVHVYSSVSESVHVHVHNSTLLLAQTSQRVLSK